ncbi:nicotinamide mononucleotide transporter [Desulfomicrobium macestii]|uniref:Nicotinamide riboside transporter PnuC n=1 Tax=Desulfomicrobium macestii TaxID=90731 RepID=A0ABR9H2A5_9BACT|nr:nicotinamide riboside transporter PnuC [Desulfomicrobium macestii]MBE1424839.1 nicotinamide mononucleotide transporter [Desulfomicrobium macestii]
MTGIEALAVLFGLLCVWFSIRQNIWCWPTGLIQVTLYIYIFYDVKLYSDLILQVIYVGLQLYGWHHWLHGGKNRDELLLSRLESRHLALWVAAAFAGTGVWGWVMATYTDASVPFWDAFTTVASLIAQWLMIKKKVESWYFWIVVDIVAIGVYAYKSLLLTSGLYMVFLLMATAGLVSWRNDFTSRSESPA